MPSFATDLSPDIVQLHPASYRNPSQLQAGGVLVVGAGNSGGEIALEVAGRHPTWLAGKESGHVPFRIEGATARFVLQPLYAMSSGFLPGVDRDAEHIVQAILAGAGRTSGRPATAAGTGGHRPMDAG